MDVITIIAILAVCIILACLAVAVWKLSGRMTDDKREAVVTQLYGLAETVWYAIEDGKLTPGELVPMFRCILSVIAALRGVNFDVVQKEFKEIPETALFEEDDTYFSAITDKNIIPNITTLNPEELIVEDLICLSKDQPYIYGVVSAPLNTTFSVQVRNSIQEAPIWNYIPNTSAKSCTDIARIPFRITPPAGGWSEGEYSMYISLNNAEGDCVYDYVEVRARIV